MQLSNNRTLYVNPAYIMYLSPSGKDYTDVVFSDGAIISVEGNEHQVATLMQLQMAEATEEEEEEEDHPRVAGPHRLPDGRGSE